MALGIIFAMEEEASAALADASFGWKEIPGTHAFESSDGKIIAAVGGIGKVFATWALSSIAAQCGTVCTMGTSGSIGDEKIGDIVLCTSFFEHDMCVEGLGYERGVTPLSGMKSPLITSISEDAIGLIESALRSSGIVTRRACAMSGDTFVSDPVTARTLLSVSGASIVDMESAAIAKICAYRLDKAFFSLRYVSDDAGHDASEKWATHLERASNVFRESIHALAGIT